MTTPELIEAVEQQPPTSPPSNVNDLLNWLSQQPPIEITPPPNTNNSQQLVLSKINELVQAIQQLIAFQNSYTVLIQIPAQVSKGILSNSTRESQFLNVAAYNKETIDSFYNRLLFWKSVRDPLLLMKINMTCLLDNITDYWVGVDDQLELVSRYGQVYPLPKSSWEESELFSGNSIVTTPGASIVTNEPGAVENLLNFLAAYQPS
jgi:hypothetical protein